MKAVIQGLKGIENIYTQHRPLLYDLLQQILSKKIDEREFPLVQSSLTPPGASLNVKNV